MPTTMPCEMPLFKKSPCWRTEWSKLPWNTQPRETVVYTRKIFFDRGSRSHRPRYSAVCHLGFL